MNAHTWLRTGCLLALTVGALYGGSGLSRVGYTALEKWGNSAPGPTKSLVDKASTIEDGVQTAINTVNLPCKGDQPCRGTLGIVNKTIVKAGDAVVQTQLVERAIIPHTVDAMDAFKGAANKLGGTADSAKGALDTFNTGLGPLMAAYTGTGKDLDAMIQENRPDVRKVLVHVAGMTASGDLILSNGAIVSTKITHDFTNPVPWYKQPSKIITLGFDAALLAK